MTEEALFELALRTPEGERVALLDRECIGQPELRARVEALLLADAAPLLPSPEPSVPPPTDDYGDPTARIGSILAGKYKLIEEIGEGGMGSVYMAQQTEPVKRAVAVKVIKAGMDSKAVLTRFEAERQALAMMDHPNIAKVLDAGSTEGSRPFFVMELVKGQSITKFCDERKLTPRQRLELFVPVCQAIQHAHQKGVIHRDIKPSNVLVAMYDDKPVPKVIDFGVAKAAGQTLTDKTLMTGFGAVVGTPEYMSPEQANTNNIDIDTRSDIYSLGVLLYVLLTGTTPVDRKSLGQAALLEILRIVREVEAPAPSAKLSTIDTLPSVAANRSTEPAILSRLMKGELDWLLLKALEKDRTRRYETANAFSRDIQRYLADEIVEARPPSTGYRLKKFVSRHKGKVIAASLVLATLVAGVIGTSFGLYEAWRQERIARDESEEKEQARKAEVEQRQLAEVEKKKAIAFRDKALEALRATTSEDVEKLIGAKKDLSVTEKAYLEAIAGRWQTFAQQEGEDEQSLATQAEGHFRVARLWQQLGRQKEAKREYEQARERWKKLAHAFPIVPAYRRDLARTHHNLGLMLAELGKRDESRSENEKARDILKSLADAFPMVPAYRQELASTHNNLGNLLTNLGQRDEARREYERARDIQKTLASAFPAVHVYRRDLAQTHQNLGILLASLGQQDEACGEYEQARDLRKSLVDAYPAVPEYRLNLSVTCNTLGILLAGIDKRDDACREFEQARRLLKTLAEEFPAVPAYSQELANTYTSLGVLLADLGQRDEARREFTHARDLQKTLTDIFPAVPAYKQQLAGTHNNLGLLLDNLGKRDEACREYEKARDLQKTLADAFPAIPEYKRDLAATHNNLGVLLDNLGKRDEARREYEMALLLQKSFANAYPAVPVYRQELADTHTNLGNLLIDQGHRDEARREYEQARDLYRKLADTFPAMPAYQVDLGGSYWRFGKLAYDDGKLTESLPWFQQSINRLRAVHEMDPRNVMAKLYLRNSYWIRAKAYDHLKKFTDAVLDWDKAIDLSEKQVQPGLRAARANSKLRAGMVAEAVAEVAELTKTPTWSAGQWYDFACVYAVASEKIADKKAEYADRAMGLLQQAVKAGYKDAAHMKMDTDLDPLRGREDFKKLLAELEQSKPVEKK